MMNDINAVCFTTARKEVLLLYEAEQVPQRLQLMECERSSITAFYQQLKKEKIVLSLSLLLKDFQL